MRVVRGGVLSPDPREAEAVLLPVPRLEVRPRPPLIFSRPRVRWCGVRAAHRHRDDTAAVVVPHGVLFATFPVDHETQDGVRAVVTVRLNLVVPSTP